MTEQGVYRANNNSEFYYLNGYGRAFELHQFGFTLIDDLPSEVMFIGPQTVTKASTASWIRVKNTMDKIGKRKPKK